MAASAGATTSRGRRPRGAPAAPPSTLVPFLFGVADRPTLPGTVLVHLLGDLGFSVEAARSAVARLRRGGALESLRHGRTTSYRLSGLAATAFEHARGVGHPDADTGGATTTWDGEFHGILHTVPERFRAHRDRLRSAALLAGYASLRPGLLIATVDRWDEVRAQVGSLPGEATVCPVVLRLAPEDARAAAAEAWRLEQRARSIRALSDRLHRQATRPVPRTGPAALRRFTSLSLPAYRTFIVAPRLPAELLPDDWPLDRLVATLAEVRARLGPATEEHVRAVFAHVSN